MKNTRYGTLAEVRDARQVQGTRGDREPGPNAGPSPRAADLPHREDDGDRQSADGQRGHAERKRRQTHRGCHDRGHE